MANNSNSHKSPKKGSNILCRVSNPTPEKVVQYVQKLPKEQMSEEKFRSLMGKNFFANEHQAPEQWGLYYIDGTTYYPRFTRDITLIEAERYLNGWLKRLIIINPYTKFKVANDNGLVLSIVKHLEDRPTIHDLKTILNDIIGSNEPLVVNEILANTLNKYSEVLTVSIVNKEKELFNVDLLTNYQEIIKTKYMKKEDYFHLFDGIISDYTPDATLQKIFYGCPGTGKSFGANKMIHKIYPKESIEEKENVFRTTFHPDSDYSTFVGCFKPASKSNGQITYSFTPQAFTEAYIQAWKNYFKDIKAGAGSTIGTTKVTVSMPASSATSPYSSTGLGAKADVFDRTPHNGYDISQNEEDLLKQVDAFLFPLVGASNFGDIHKRLTVHIDDRIDPDTKICVYHRDEIEREIADLKSRLGERPNDNLPEGQRYYMLRRLLSEMDENNTDTLEKESSFSIWGIHSSVEDNEETVTIYKGQIEDDLPQRRIQSAVVATYIHEMFHAYFKKNLNIPEIEEPIVECATLCFLVLMSSVLGNEFTKIFDDYRYIVDGKKRIPGFAYYGFGSFLFEHRSLDWIELFNNASIDGNSKDVEQFTGFFDKLYPFGNEQKAIELLYRILKGVSLTASNTDALVHSVAPVFLVIEEINRGNCAQIFGDLFQLLDRNDNGFSTYPIKADTDLGNYIAQEFAKAGISSAAFPSVVSGSELILPFNLHILATMNTSDQSLFPMDSAFKRRWLWEYVPIDYAKEESNFKITIGNNTYEWPRFLKAVNQRIHKLTGSEDKQMGNFFIKHDVDVEEFKSKVMFYLWSDVCKEYENSGSFFKNKRDNDAEFTFNNLFPTDDATNGILQGFMEFLGV